MDRILIRGGARLEGAIHISGAKNAALPLMVASLLTDETLTLRNVPDLADIGQLAAILGVLGVAADFQRSETATHTMVLTAGTINSTTAPYDLVRRMRASFLVLGPLLARRGEARVSLPGGCAIGPRPVDLHLKGLEAMGAAIALEDGYVVASASGGLKGARFSFPFVSVGATENLMMAASLARGTTILENAAREPEIAELGTLINLMGGRVEGIGTATLAITGVPRLSGADFAVVADRIETGTFAMAVGATGGEVELLGARPDHLGAVIPVLEQTGLSVTATNQGMKVKRNGVRPRPADITTAPYPGFPTDLQAQFMALMATADGISHITETIFENRFMHVPELARMGAHIEVDGQKAIVHGVGRLKGAPVMATDLRASVSLVIAGLAAEGDTIVNRVYHLDRGFERLERKLTACGAGITRLKD